MMRATDLLETAYSLGMIGEAEIHKKWISVSHKLAAIAGVTHLVALESNNRLDLMLRLVESERLERLKSNSLNEIDWSLDLQISLSECWVLRAYEILRACKQQLKDYGPINPKLLSLQHRLAVVRVPIAKGEIESMDRKANKGYAPMLGRMGETVATPYELDGSYVMPRAICPETGAAMWYPVDMKARQTVAICRRDLSDELLSLFD